MQGLEGSGPNPYASEHNRDNLRLIFWPGRRKGVKIFHARHNPASHGPVALGHVQRINYGRATQD